MNETASPTSAAPTFSEPAEIHTPQPTSSGVTPRVVALCLGLAVLFGYLLPIIDVKLSNTYLGSSHLPPGAIGVLLVLLLVINPLLRLLSRRLAFQRNELLTVYITCLFSCLVPGHSGENFFVPNLIGSFYYATRENKWLEFLGPYLKPWFTPSLDGSGTYQRAVVEGWYLGGPVPWGAWLVPLVAWGTFIFASYFMLACLSVMLRAQWAEREALAFPLLRLPLEMTEGAEEGRTLSNFFRTPATWIGFGIAAFIQTLNGLNAYFPDVPTVPMSLNTASLFTEAPWNQLGMTPLSVWPLAVGVAYLLTAEVSFSLWFFYWFIKLQYIGAYLIGYMPSALPTPIGATAASGAKAFTSFQQVGAFLAYTAIMLWLGREHFRHVARRAFGRTPATDAEKHEAMSYPFAFWGFVGAFTFMVAWSVAAGIRPELAILLWLAYLVISTALTRVVVEGGLLSVQQGWTPLGTMAQLIGSGPGTLLPPSSVVPATIIQASIITDMRAFLMPSFMQSFKLAHDRKISARPLIVLIFACVAITLTLSLYMNVRLGYDHGGLSLNKWFATQGAQLSAINTRELINGARDAGILNWLSMGVGIALTSIMVAVRSRFLWFPFHPIGYLMSLTGPVHHLWFSIFLGWTCKTLITRLGGNETYRKTTPLFLGLVLGDVAMMLFWLAIDGWQGRSGHQITIP